MAEFSPSSLSPPAKRGGDDGVHRIVAEPEGDTARAFDSVVQRITEELERDSGRSLRIV